MLNNGSKNHKNDKVTNEQKIMNNITKGIKSLSPDEVAVVIDIKDTSDEQCDIQRKNIDSKNNLDMQEVDEGIH